MTKLLRDVIDRVQRWPDDRQDQAAQVLLDLEAQQDRGIRLTPDQVKEVERIQQNVRSGHLGRQGDVAGTHEWVVRAPPI